MRGCLVVTLLLTILSITACSSTYTNRTPTEEFFPSVSAKDLNDRDGYYCVAHFFMAHGIYCTYKT